LTVEDKTMSEFNYANDSRVQGSHRRWWKTLEASRLRATITVYGEDAEGDFEEDREVPVKFEVCPTCDGKGSHVNPSVDCDGLTAEDFAEDPDFLDEYVSGRYDVPCYECHGERVVPVINEERCDPETLRLVRERQDADLEEARMRASEARFGY
jgi:hypothetical protein